MHNGQYHRPPLSIIPSCLSYQFRSPIHSAEGCSSVLREETYRRHLQLGKRRQIGLLQTLQLLQSTSRVASSWLNCATGRDFGLRNPAFSLPKFHLLLRFFGSLLRSISTVIQLSACRRSAIEICVLQSLYSTSFAQYSSALKDRISPTTKTHLRDPCGKASRPPPAVDPRSRFVIEIIATLFRPALHITFHPVSGHHHRIFFTNYCATLGIRVFELRYSCFYVSALCLTSSTFTALAAPAPTVILCDETTSFKVNRHFLRLFIAPRSSRDPTSSTIFTPIDDSRVEHCHHHTTRLQHGANKSFTARLGAEAPGSVK